MPTARDSTVRPPRLRVWLALLGLAVLMCAYVGCRSNHPGKLSKLAPRVPPDITRALAAGDTSSLRLLLRERGLAASGLSLWQMYGSLPTTSFERFREGEAQVQPFARMLGRSVDAEFPHNEVVTRWSVFLSHSVQERFEIVRNLQENYTLATESNLPIHQREQRYRTLIERARPYQDCLDLGDLYGSYANLLPRLNRQDEMPYYLRLGIQTATANGFATSACQLLGTLGVIYQNANDERSMRACWDRAIDLARQTDNWQEARILSFYAAYHRSRGQFAVARDLLLQAQDRCRELQASQVELRFLFDSLQLFGSLGCWEMVGRGLQRGEVLKRQGSPSWGPAEADLWAGRVQQMRARYLAATGACAAAESLALDLAEQTEHWQPTPPREEAVLDAARALLGCGNAREAHRLLERGIQQCHAYGMPELLEEFSLEAALAYFALGDFGQCAEALDAFRSHATSNPSEDVVRNWIRHDALAVRLAMQTQGKAAAVERLEIALERLAKQQRQLSAGPESYLALAAADELRELAHQILDGSPERGYALEMAWMRFRARQQHTAGLDSGLGVVALATSERAAVPPDLSQRLRAQRAVHCIYDVRDSSVVRWTATAAGVTRDLLPASRAQLEGLVARLAARLADRDRKGTLLDEQTVRELHQLATWLLPDALVQAPASTRLLVTADGFLCRLPFEVLSLAADRYEPLLATHDVAYLRLWRDDSPAHEGTAVLVSHPAYPTGLRRRYSVLNEDLKLGAEEAELFRRLLPHSVLLDGAQATKHDLLERWKGARFLYFACHVVQDPEVPYIAFVPMATAASGRDEDAYLELSDILNADLSGCELVVLSSCASGAPYVEERVASPSLGDAFVDAGAKAVVSTFWSVRDDAAARAMREFARAYRGQGADAVAALGEARRRPHPRGGRSARLGGLRDHPGGAVAGCVRGARGVTPRCGIGSDFRARGACHALWGAETGSITTVVNSWGAPEPPAYKPRPSAPGVGARSPWLALAQPGRAPYVAANALGNRASTAMAVWISRSSTHSPILCVFCSMPGPTPNMAGCQ